MADPEPSEVAERIGALPVPGEHARLVGHDRERAELRAALESGRMHHAWLIGGPKGIGKATLALDFAVEALANGSTDDRSRTRRMIAAGSHPGLLHLARGWDRTTKRFRSQISVEDVRKTQSFFGLTASGPGKRICIVDSADVLTVAAANALLKSLEEPPKNSLFLVLADAPGRILPTIRSRCRSLRLQPLSDAQIAAVMQHMDVELSGAVLERIVALSQGSVRRALQLCETDVLPLWTKFETIAAGRDDWGRAHELADQLASRSRTDQFNVFYDLLFAWLGERVRDRVATPDALARWSTVWKSVTDTLDTADEYNLDRRQAILDVFGAIFRAKSR